MKKIKCRESIICRSCVWCVYRANDRQPFLLSKMSFEDKKMSGEFTEHHSDESHDGNIVLCVPCVGGVADVQSSINDVSIEIDIVFDSKNTEDSDEDDEPEFNVADESEIDYSTVEPNTEMIRSFIDNHRIEDRAATARQQNVYVSANARRQFTQIAGDKDEKLRKLERKLALLTAKHRSIRNREQNIGRFSKRLVSGELVKIDIDKRCYNKIAASMRAMVFSSLIPSNDVKNGVRPTKSQIDPSWAQNICKSHGIKSNRAKKCVKDGSYCPVFRDAPGDCEMGVLHSSRRTMCKYPRDFLVSFLSGSLENAVLDVTHNKSMRRNTAPRYNRDGSPNLTGIPLNHGQLRSCFKFGSSEQHIFTDEQLMFPCPCTPRNEVITVEKGVERFAPCGKYIWAEDPQLLAQIPESDRARWQAMVDNAKTCAIRRKYGNDYVQFCIVPGCKHASEPFIDKTIVDALTGKLANAVHINKRTCPDPGCGTTWCRECGMTPYHDDQICRGKIYEKIKDWSSEDKERYLATVKLCPNKSCGVETQLNGGCDHIECKMCKTHWCWRCRGIRTGDPYNHRCPANATYDASRHHTDHGSPDQHGHDVKTALAQLRKK